MTEVDNGGRRSVLDFGRVGLVRARGEMDELRGEV